MGDRHPLDDPIALELLRPALERAFVTVRAGQRATPPVDPPSSLRPFLRFTRLRGRALAAVRAAIEADDDLRARVGDAADDGELGAVGELWIERPEGWEAALADLIDERRSADDQRRSDAAEQELARRVTAVERERDKLAAARDAAAEEAGAARDELAVERRRRQEAEEWSADAVERIEALGRRTTRAEERARSAEASLGEERARVRELRERIAQLEAETAGRPTAATPVAEPAAASEPAETAPPLPLHDIASMLGDAASGADRLARSLASLVEVFSPPAETSTNGARRPESGVPGLVAGHSCSLA